MYSIISKLIAATQGHLLFIGVSTLIMSFIMPVAHFLILMGGLVIADTLSGVVGALRQGVALESRKAYRTLEKLVVYTCAILAAHGINLVFIEPLELDLFEKFTLVHIAAGSICFTEFLSLKENIQKATGVDLLGGFKKALSVFTGSEPSKSDTPNS